MRGSSRTRIFVGDVHGCADELQDLLEALGYDPRQHALHFVGDLVNRGPKSLQTLRDVIRLGADCVLGNHELHLLARAVGHRGPAPLDTLDELLAAPDHEVLLDWVRSRPLLRLWPDVVLVHAGLPSSWNDLEAEAARVNGLVTADALSEHPDVRFLVAARRCDAHGQMIHGAAGIPWYDLYERGRTVVFGHWAERGLVNTERLRGLDTGCVWGGRLTAWIAESDEFVSVPARTQYQEP